MKNLKLLSIISLLALTLVGCAAPVNEAAADREKELENRIAELEQEITSLEKENSASSDTVSNETAPTNVTAAENDSLDSLKTLVDETIKKVDSAAPGGTYDENHSKFFELKDELDAVDNRIDSYDDYLEAQHRQNILSHKEYRTMEAELEKLEDALDDAEDRLEHTFRMDD